MSINLSVPEGSGHQELKPRITVVGVGGAGGNAVNNMIRRELGGVDFVSMYIVLSGDVPAGMGLDAARETGAAIFAYGAFITACINFLIIAFVVFMLVRMVNRLKAAAEKPDDVAPEVDTGPSELDVLLQIRDQLAKS